MFRKSWGGSFYSIQTLYPVCAALSEVPNTNVWKINLTPDCISYPMFLVNKISQVITAYYERKTVEDYCTLGLPATKFLSFSKQIAVGYVH